MTPLECRAVAALDLPQGCRVLQALFDPARGGARCACVPSPGQHLGAASHTRALAGGQAEHMLSHHRGLHWA
jgi:hypothetical protein